MAEVILTHRADRDYERAARYVRRKAPLGVGSWLRRLEEAIQSLSWNPDRFALSTFLAPDGTPYREMLFGRRRGTFRVLYRITPNAVIVHRIVRATVNQLD